MQAVMESTTKVVTLSINGVDVPARIWEGTTAGGVPFHAFVTRVAVHNGLNHAELVHELLEQKVPSAKIAAIPNRMVL